MITHSQLHRVRLLLKLMLLARGGHAYDMHLSGRQRINVSVHDQLRIGAITNNSEIEQPQYEPSAGYDCVAACAHNQIRSIVEPAPQP
jgi:CO/xanthine dehydrogenase FAD-binding subunit